MNKKECVDKLIELAKASYSENSRYNAKAVLDSMEPVHLSSHDSIEKAEYHRGQGDAFLFAVGLIASIQEL